MNHHSTMKSKKLLVAGLFFGFFFIYFSWLHFQVFNFAPFQKYPALARSYLQGTLSPERLLDVSPTYFYLNVLAAKMSSQSEFWIKWLQMLLLAGSSGLFFLTLQNWFSLTVSSLGTLLLMLNTHVLIYSGIMEPELLLLFFLLAFIFFAQGIGPFAKILSGVSFALMILTRPNLIPLIFLVPVHFWLQEKKWRKCTVSFSLFIIPFLIALMGLWLRNYSIEGHFSPLVMNPSTVFYEGNNPCSRGKSSVYPLLVDEMISEYKNYPDYQHVMYREFARRITGLPLSVGQVNAYWFRKAWLFIQDHPGHFLRNLMDKINAAFNNYRRHDILSAFVSDQKLSRSWLPRIPYALIAALGLVGLFMGIREKQRFFLIYILFFTQLLAMIFTYVSARQQLALIPLLVIFSAQAIHNLIRNKKWLFFSLTFIPLVLLNLLRTDWFTEEDHLWQCRIQSSAFKTQAENLRGEDRLDEASVYNCLALARSPWLYEWLRLADLPLSDGRWLNEALFRQQKNPAQDFSSRFDQGTLLWLAGNNQAATSIFQQLHNQGYQFSRDFEQSAQPLYYLARIKVAEKFPIEAIELLKKGLQLSPGDPYILAELVVLTGETHYRDQLFRYYDDLDAQFFIGQAYLENDQAEKALPCLAYVSQLLPEFRRGLIYYAVALARSGHTANAATTYITALNRRRDPVFFEEDIIRLFQEWHQQNSPDQRSGYYLGLILRQYGRLKESQNIFIQEQSIFPQDDQIIKQLDWLKKVSKN